MAILKIALLTLLAQVGMPSAQPASVQGIVLTAAGGLPVSGATVEVRRVDGSPPQSYAATTFADGTFLVPAVRSGEYRLIARRNGYQIAEYGQRRPEAPGIPFTLAAGQQMRGVQVAMAPASAIYGRVYNRQGDPVGGVDVAALVSAYDEGRRTLRVVQTAVSNDLGEYRLFGLLPGRYYIGATPSNGRDFLSLARVLASADAVGDSAGLMVRGANAQLGESYLFHYYPGVLDPRRASPIDLRIGNLGGVDISVSPIPTPHVRGSARSIGEHMSLTLTPLTPFPGLRNHEAAVDPETGLFDIPDVAPGAYLLVAVGTGTTGRQIVEVGETGAENVRVAVAGEVEIPSRLVIDNREPSDNEPDMDHIYLDIATDPKIPGLDSDTYSPLPNGKFVMRLTPGDYRFALSLRNPTPTLQNAYLKSIRLGNQDVLNGGLHLAEQPSGTMEFVVGTRPGSLSGTVYDAQRTPVANATVVLGTNAVQRSHSDTYRTARTDATGRFQIRSIPPGDYKVFAWEDVEETAWQDPAFMKLYEDRGKPVHLNESARETAEIVVIP